MRVLRQAMERILNHNNRSSSSGGGLFEALEARAMLSVGPFADDPMEPNDSRREVQSMNPTLPGSPNFGELEGEVVVKRLRLLDKRDTYRIVLKETGGANDYAQINFNTKVGNLDLRLMDTDGITLYRSVGNGNKERLSLEGVPEGEYFIQVQGRNGATNGNYKLTVNVESKADPDYEYDDLGPPSMTLPDGTAVLEDSYEYGNDSIIAVRQQAEGGKNSPNLGVLKESVKLNKLYLSDSKDMYRLDLSGEFFASGFVRVSSPEALNLALFDTTGKAVAFADAYMGEDTIDLTRFAGSEVFIMVTHYAYENPLNVEYSLEFNVGTA